MPYMFRIVGDRLLWKLVHGVKMKDVYGHWRYQKVDRSMLHWHRLPTAAAVAMGPGVDVDGVRLEEVGEEMWRAVVPGRRSGLEP
jgi:hypothetical protein